MSSAAELALLASVVALAALTLLVQRRTRTVPVPTLPREREAVVRLLRAAALPERALIVDLGCGFGGLVVQLARAFPSASVVGHELSPLPYLVAKLRSLRQPNADVHFGDFHRADLRGVSAIVCYLSRAAMAPLARTLDTQLRPGTPVVSFCFWFSDRTAERVERATGLGGEAALYRW